MYLKNNRNVIKANVLTTSAPVTSSNSGIDKKINTYSYFANEYQGKDTLRGEMNFSSRETVEKLKAIYRNINYYDKFEKGDLSVYNDYAEKYTQLLKGRVQYYDLEENVYRNLYNFEPETQDEKRFSSGYLFDIDKDGKPELCIMGVYDAYVFKYIPESGQIVKWWKQNGANLLFMGSGKTSQATLDGAYYFTQLTESAEDEFELLIGSWSTDVFFVSLPTYADGLRREDTIEEMRLDGYYDEWYYGDGRGQCIFRVTEEEYREITTPFFDACERVYEDQDAVIFEPWKDW